MYSAYNERMNLTDMRRFMSAQDALRCLWDEDQGKR